MDEETKGGKNVALPDCRYLVGWVLIAILAATIHLFAILVTL